MAFRNNARPQGNARPQQQDNGGGERRSKGPKREAMIRTATPVGTASKVYVHKPDSEGEYATNKYKITVVCEPDDPALARFKAVLLKAAQIEFGPRANEKNVVLPIKDGTAESEKYKEKQEDRGVTNPTGLPDYEGKVLIEARSNNAPELKDSDLQPLEDGVYVNFSDLVQLSVQTYPCTVSGQKRIALRLFKVRLIEKRSGGGGSSDDNEFAEYDQEFGNAGNGFGSDNSFGGNGGSNSDFDDDIPF